MKKATLLGYISDGLQLNKLATEWSQRGYAIASGYMSGSKSIDDLPTEKLNEVWAVPFESLEDNRIAFTIKLLDN